MPNQRLTLTRPANQALSLTRPSPSLTLTRPDEPSAIHGYVKDAVVVGSPPVLTLNALPYSRTVAMGSISLSGTATESPTSISWTASPSGASGSFTPAANWSGSVSIPAGGVETISITASNAFGTSNTVQVTVGLYVDGAHTWFNAQNIDGAFNATLVDNDPVATWNNLGSSALNVTQSTPTARPTYKTAIVGGQPIVRFANDDELVAANVNDWLWTGQSPQTLEACYKHSDTGTIQMPVGTFNTEGAYMGCDTRSTRTGVLLTRLTPSNLTTEPTNIFALTTFDLHQARRDSTLTPPCTMWGNGTQVDTEATSVNLTPNLALKIGRASSFNFAGDIWQVRWYQSGLSLAQVQLNEAVDEWALGAAFPVTP